MELAARAEYFRDPGGVEYARFPVGGHHEVAQLCSREFHDWLGRWYFRLTGQIASAHAMKQAVDILEGKARFEDLTRSVHLRVAQLGGAIYIDLCDPSWQVVEITPGGWRVLADSPVMFRRTRGMLPLPIPVTGGSLDEFRALVNVDDRDWPLVTAWLINALRSEGPYAHLAVHGEQGSAKTTLCKMLRQLVDPHQTPLRSEPRKPEDLVLAAHNGCVVGIDNASQLSSAVSDALCRLSTGGGFASRTLFSNDEETLFDAQRPVLINGIEELATRSDLLDRCLLLNLRAISTDRRRAEVELWTAFEEARPRILGALCTAVAHALRELPNTLIDNLPRLADFALLATAGEPALGLASGEFLQAYERNLLDGVGLAIDAHPAGAAIVNFIAEVGGAWTGTASELLAALRERIDDRTRSQRAWPKDPRALSASLRRLSANLRRLGIQVEFGRDGSQDKRLITITTAQATGEFASFASDERVDGQTPVLGGVDDADDAKLHRPKNIAAQNMDGAAGATGDRDAEFRLEFAELKGFIWAPFGNWELPPIDEIIEWLKGVDHEDPPCKMGRSIDPCSETIRQGAETWIELTSERGTTTRLVCRCVAELNVFAGIPICGDVTWSNRTRASLSLCLQRRYADGIRGKIARFDELFAIYLSQSLPKKERFQKESIRKMRQKMGRRLRG